MKFNKQLGQRMIMVMLVLAMVYSAFAATSVIDNFNTTESQLNLSLKVQFYNSSSEWEDSINVYNDLISINSTTVNLVDYWNNTWWNASGLSQGYGTYRAYAALIADNGSVISSLNGSLLESYYNFTYAASQNVNITWTNITPDHDDVTSGSQINPIETSNISVSIIANLSNSSAVDSCSATIFNSSATYASPTKTGTGSIIYSGSQVQCNASWQMAYWENSGNWSVVVDVNLTDSNSDQSNSSFFYNVLTSHTVNLTSINYTGVPGSVLNSSNAYPLGIQNTGNNRFNISIKGTDFIGSPDASFNFTIGNSSYSATEGGSYVNMTSGYVQITDLNDLGPNATTNLFFRGFIPVGMKSQDYSNTISIQSS